MNLLGNAADRTTRSRNMGHPCVGACFCKRRVVLLCHVWTFRFCVIIFVLVSPEYYPHLPLLTLGTLGIHVELTG